MTVVLGLIFGLTVVGTFGATLYIVIRGYRELDKTEPEEINKKGVIKKRQSMIWGIIIGFITIGGFIATLVIVVKGERELDKPSKQF